MNRLLDAGSIVAIFLGVLLVAAFTTQVSRDKDLYMSSGQWIDLENLGWDGLPFGRPFGLSPQRADQVSGWLRWAGWGLFAFGTFVQLYRVLN